MELVALRAPEVGAGCWGLGGGRRFSWGPSQQRGLLREALLPPLPPLCSLPSSPLPTARGWASPSTPTGKPGLQSEGLRASDNKEPGPHLPLRRRPEVPQRPARSCGSLAPHSAQLPGCSGPGPARGPSEDRAWHPQIEVTAQRSPAGRGPAQSRLPAVEAQASAPQRLGEKLPETDEGGQEEGRGGRVQAEQLRQERGPGAGLGRPPSPSDEDTFSPVSSAR